MIFLYSLILACIGLLVYHLIECYKAHRRVKRLNENRTKDEILRGVWYISG